MPKLKNLTGQRFGRLSVIRREGSDPHGFATWFCECDCGNQSIVSGSDLTKSHTKSCGCLRNELSRERCTKHGKNGTRLYEVWKSMNQRCSNEANAGYRRYGGRGIAVCEDWQNDFQAFYNWAIAHGYDETAPRGKCSIDRIDNDKGYSPDNCRWVDMKTQINNRSNTRRKQ